MLSALRYRVAANNAEGLSHGMVVARRRFARPGGGDYLGPDPQPAHGALAAGVRGPVFHAVGAAAGTGTPHFVPGRPLRAQSLRRQPRAGPEAGRALGGG